MWGANPHPHTIILKGVFVLIIMIACVVIVVICTLTGLYGLCLHKIWRKDVGNWKTPQQAHNEYAGCLLTGWAGIMAEIFGFGFAVMCLFPIIIMLITGDIQ